MKRWICILAAACLLCGAAAADTTPLRVFSIGANTPEDFAAKYPDLPVELIHVSYDSSGLSNKRELLLAGNWDVATVAVGSGKADDITLQELYSSGLVMDLSQSTALAARAEGLFPAVKDAVTAGGMLLALPYRLYRDVAQYQITTWPGETQSTFARLGFTQADIPHTFRELADLAEAYMALPAETRKGTIFDVNCVDSSAYAYFLYYLIELYTAEFCDAAGIVDYDTPAFRASLEDLQRLISALDKDPKVRRAQDGSLCGIINDASQMFSGSSADRINLDLYIQNGERIPANLRVLVVNPHTTQVDKALHYVSVLAAESAAWFDPLLYADADYAALARLAYETQLADLQAGDAKPAYVDTFISTYENDPEAYYAQSVYSRAQLADYQSNTAPRLAFPPVPLVSAATAAETFIHNNELDAEGLIRYLNESVQAEQEETP